MIFLKQSPTGRFNYFQSDIGLRIVRLDYNPNQPRDSRGRFASGGGGGGGGSGRGGGRKGGGGGLAAADLSKKKLADLQAIAKEAGAEVPTQYANRKSSWIAAIEKVQVRPLVPVVEPRVGGVTLGRHTPESLSKKKLADLQAIAKEVGAEIPGQYKNRKSAWIDAIQKAQGNKPETPVAPKPPAAAVTSMPKVQGDFYRAESFIHQELIKSGESYTQKFLPTIKPSAKETELLDRLSRLKAQAQEAFDKGRTSENARLLDKFYSAQDKWRALRKERESKEVEGFQQLRTELKKQSVISTAEAQAIANKVNLSLSTLDSRQVNPLKDTMADFFELTGGRGSSSLKQVRKESDRAWASTDGTINIGSHPGSEHGFSKAAFFHEMGHHVEYESPALLNAAIAYRDSKFTSTKLEKLSDITGSSDYEAHELAVRGKFVYAYAGKVTHPTNALNAAGDKYDPAKQGSATEVVSMGLERFQSPELMREFKDKDPDYFHFMVGVLTNREN